MKSVIMTDKENIYNLINGSIIEKLIEQVDKRLGFET